MPRDLFGNVTRPSISVGSRKWYTLPVSLLSHSAIVLALIAIPILAPAVMPSVFADTEIDYFIPIVPSPPPVPQRLENVPPRPVDDPGAVAPITAPDGFTPEPPHPHLEVTDNPGTIGGGVIDANVVLAPPPAPVIKAPPAPVRVGGTIRQPQKIRNVDPTYSQVAIAARIQGIVIIEATIGEDGRVMNARILRSIPLLDQSALEAVRQWQFTPTLLNGVPVPVIMTVTVNFTLSK